MLICNLNNQDYKVLTILYKKEFKNILKYIITIMLLNKFLLGFFLFVEGEMRCIKKISCLKTQYKSYFFLI
jgi:hypothetical protein